MGDPYLGIGAILRDSAERDALQRELEASNIAHRETGRQLAEMGERALAAESQLASRDKELLTLREKAQEACDLLAERKHGSAARSPGHNARLVLEAALTSTSDTAAAIVERIRGEAWRPIGTAPKDPMADTLLGFVDGKVRLIYWGKTSHVPLYGWNLADQGAEECDLCEPTHWMPLPAPPALNAEQREGA